jgi:hypothetical protein
MKISEVIKHMHEYLNKHGDLPVSIRDHSENYQFPFMEVESIDFVKNHTIINEDDGSEEILNFIALDYM